MDTICINNEDNRRDIIDTVRDILYYGNGAVVNCWLKMCTDADMDMLPIVINDYVSPHKNDTWPEDVYVVPSVNMRLIRNKVEEINKRGEKYDIPPCHFHELFSYRIKQTAHSFIDYTVVVPLMSQVMTCGDYELIATYEPRQNGTPLIKSVGNKEGLKNIPEMWRNYLYNNADFCDHCEIRRYRNKSYIFRHKEQGYYRLVGSSCAKDFLGMDLSYFMKFYRNFMGLAGGAGVHQVEPQFDLTTMTAFAVRTINAYGYRYGVSSWNCTAQRLWHFICSDRSKDGPKSEHIKEAEEAIKWGSSLPVSETDDKKTVNTRTIAKQNTVFRKDFRWVCHLVDQYRKYKREQAHQKRISTVSEGRISQRHVVHTTNPWEESSNKVTYAAPILIRIVGVQNTRSCRLVRFLTVDNKLGYFFEGFEGTCKKGDIFHLVGDCGSYTEYRGEWKTHFYNVELKEV